MTEGAGMAVRLWAGQDDAGRQHGRMHGLVAVTVSEGHFWWCQKSLTLDTKCDVVRKR